MKPVQLTPPVKVWYKSFPINSQIFWPVLEIELSHKERNLPQSVLSLIDSGANYSILHMHVAEALGFNLTKLGKPNVGGSSVSGFYKSWILPEPITVNVFGYSYGFRFQVIDNQDLVWPCILGENSIFEVAKIDFQKYKGFFELRFRENIN